MTLPLDCFDPNHFQIVDGAIAPQPWMQWRHLRRVEAATKTQTYAVTGGANKNDLLHALQLGWLNDTPVPQWVYGKITRGGARVSLTARSRGYLQLASGYKLAAGDPGALVVCDRFGVGADLARSGTLGTGTTFAVIEERQPSKTINLAPERTGWQRVNPGQSITARAELRFISEFWENATIDGGDSGADSSIETGGTRLDLFAVPVI
ncbi:hypothetical protein I5G58_gp040 [Mycobacterium phage BirdsNest]|uniref:DUF7172 domain-containing protein n=1 Tax=Mycobacterium phage BirdsNest TaxID=2686231 RepID=A0A6B9L6R5_9CAUD|nr:hypothetical protein I5G58_gp040 [Mycobacterium phage BirdsNest]QHB37342.1 hypothetical protein PBI_BIRDSNEST_40 [Mycobacterium phage BirdsNest]